MLKLVTSNISNMKQCPSLMFMLVSFLSLLYIPAYGQYLDDMYRDQADVLWNGGKLPERSTISVRFEYDSTLFCGLSYKDYCLRDSEFAEGLKKAEGRFFETLKEELWDLKPTRKRFLCVTAVEDPDFVFVVIPRKINDNGDFRGEVLILDAEGRTFGSIGNVFGVGGRHGDYTNLIGDGYKSIAETVAYFLADAIRARKI